MASSTDTAKDLLKLAGGPAIVGVGALLGYTRAVLADDERNSTKGWIALGAGVLLVAWLMIFIVWSLPTVWRSLFADGDPQVRLVLLAATWLVALGLAVAAIARAPAMARYVCESYRAGEGPWPVRFLRRVLGTR